MGWLRIISICWLRRCSGSNRHKGKCNDNLEQIILPFIFSYARTFGNVLWSILQLLLFSKFSYYKFLKCTIIEYLISVNIIPSPVYTVVREQAHIILFIMRLLNRIILFHIPQVPYPIFDEQIQMLNPVFYTS